MLRNLPVKIEDVKVEVTGKRIGALPKDVQTATVDLVIAALRQAGYKGTWKIRFKQQIRQKSELKFSPLRVDGHAILIRTKPGDNATAWESYITPPHGVGLIDALTALTVISRVGIGASDKQKAPSSPKELPLILKPMVPGLERPKTTKVAPKTPVGPPKPQAIFPPAEPRPEAQPAPETPTPAPEPAPVLDAPAASLDELVAMRQAEAEIPPPRAAWPTNTYRPSVDDIYERPVALSTLDPNERPSRDFTPFMHRALQAMRNRAEELAEYGYDEILRADAISAIREACNLDPGRGVTHLMKVLSREKLIERLNYDSGGTRAYRLSSLGLRLTKTGYQLKPLPQRGATVIPTTEEAKEPIAEPVVPERAPEQPVQAPVNVVPATDVISNLAALQDMVRNYDATLANIKRLDSEIADVKLMLADLEEQRVKAMSEIDPKTARTIEDLRKLLANVVP